MKLINNNLQITRAHRVLGTLTLDTATVNEKDYQFYYDNGFSDCFEVAEQVTEEQVVTETDEEKTIPTKKKYKGITNTKK